MGVKHIRLVLDFFAKNKGNFYSIALINREIKTHYNIICETLDYLVEDKKITKKDINGVIKYGIE